MNGNTPQTQTELSRDEWRDLKIKGRDLHWYLAGATVALRLLGLVFPEIPSRVLKNLLGTCKGAIEGVARRGAVAEAMAMRFDAHRVVESLVKSGCEVWDRAMAAPESETAKIIPGAMSTDIRTAAQAEAARAAMNEEIRKGLMVLPGRERK
mgnify:CR=1 FL=1